MPTIPRLLLPLAALQLYGFLTAHTQTAPATVEWPTYGRDGGGTRYAPLDDINRGNVARLKLAWTYHTGQVSDTAPFNSSFEATPLMVNGTLYLSTPQGKVVALDPESGKERWTFDAKVDRTLDFADYATRGVSFWTDPRAASGTACRSRIIVATVDARLIALDADHGRICTSFADRGTLNLRNGLRNPPAWFTEYDLTSPPAIVNGMIVTGSGVSDNGRAEGASGEVRGFDAKTGALRWSWDPVPQDSTDPAWATWKGPRAHHTGAANAWSVIAADSARDLVFVPTSSPSVDYFGGTRLGDNRYANSIVALRASTGKVVWSFQTVHHDLWDYDNASPPALVTINHGGRSRDVVVQATKTGQLFVLDRETGEPVFGVEERPVPLSTVPGEVAAPTQPFTTVIPPLSPHHFSADSAWGVTDEERAACRAMMTGLRSEGIFTPPSLEGTLVIPANIGGAQWGGLAIDPARGVAIIPVNRIAAMVQLILREEVKPADAQEQSSRLGYEYTDMGGTPFYMRRRILLSPGGLPCTPPPFGALLAIDLNTGSKLWEVPLGTLPLRDGSLGPAEWGSPMLGGPMITAGGVVFIAATIDRMFRAYDLDTGRELWRAALPAGGKATPMTYRIGTPGRQYIVIAAGGDGSFFGQSDAVLVFTLGE